MVLDRMGEHANNDLQHDLNEEVIFVLNEATGTNDAFFDVDTIRNMLELVGDSACGAYEFGQEHAYAPGYRLLDFASSISNTAKATGTFLYHSGKGALKGCWNAGTFPFVLAKNLATAPQEAVSGIIGGITQLTACLLQAIRDTTTVTSSRE